MSSKHTEQSPGTSEAPKIITNVTKIRAKIPDSGDAASKVESKSKPTGILDAAG